MLSYEILEDDGIAVMASVGQATFEDYENVMPKFLAEVRLRAIRKLLLDHRKHEGWASGKAKSISFDAWKEARAVFDKVAYVVPDSTEALGLSEFFRNAEKDIRQLSPSQYDAALDWLKGDRAAENQE